MRSQICFPKEAWGKPYRLFGLWDVFYLYGQMNVFAFDVRVARFVLKFGLFYVKKALPAFL